MAELRGRKKTTDLDLCIIQDLSLKLLSLRSLAGWMDLRVRWQRQKIGSQSQRERPKQAYNCSKMGGESVWICDHRRGENLPEGNVPFQRGETRVSSKKEIVGISGLGIVFPGCIHSQVPGLVSEEGSSCFRHWVIRYTQGNIPTAIKA